MTTLSVYPSPQEQELSSLPIAHRINYRSNLTTLPPIQEDEEDTAKTTLNDEKSQLSIKSSGSTSTNETVTSTPSLFDVHLSFHKDSISAGSIYPTTPIQEDEEDKEKTAQNDEKSQLSIKSSGSTSTDDTVTSTPSLFDVHLSFIKDSISVGSIYRTSQEENLPGKCRERMEGSTNLDGESDESSNTQLFKQSLGRKEGSIDLNTDNAVKSTHSLFDVHLSFHKDSISVGSIYPTSKEEKEESNNTQLFKQSLERKLGSINFNALLDNTEDTRLSEQSFGLLRARKGIYLPSTQPTELFLGAILGRTIVSKKSGKKRLPRNQKDLKRVDIGIGYKCKQGKYDDGISRNQIEVLKIDDDGILIKVCEGVRNPIAIRSHGYHHYQYGPGAIKYLQEGDELIFDAYMKRPKHIFKIVSVATKQHQGIQEI